MGDCLHAGLFYVLMLCLFMSISQSLLKCVGQDHPEGVIVADPMADCLPGTGIPCTG